MNQDKFEEYFNLKQQIANLEEKKEALAVELMDEMDDSSTKEATLPFGIFIIRERRTWDYSESVKQMDKRIKELKKKEERDGMAFLKNVSRHIAMIQPEQEKE